MPEQPDASIKKEVHEAMDAYFRENAAGTYAGQLGIREQRSWHTWQLALAGGLTLLIGMWVGYATYPTGNGTAQASGRLYSISPSAGSSGASTTTTPTTTVASTTTTTAATTATTANPTAGPPVPTILLGPTQQSGNWTSTAFTVSSGTWNIGWAYKCTPAPSAGTSINVFVYAVGATPGTTPAVTQTGAEGKGITPQTTSGHQMIQVQAPANCVWAIKVTGVGTAS